jgi:hypothetical protein
MQGVWNISGLELRGKYRNTRRCPAHCHLVHNISHMDWFRIEPGLSWWAHDHWLRLSLSQLPPSTINISHNQHAASDKRESSAIQLNSVTWDSEMTKKKRKIFSDITLHYVTFDKCVITFERHLQYESKCIKIPRTETETDQTVSCVHFPLLNSSQFICSA